MYLSSIISALHEHVWLLANLTFTLLQILTLSLDIFLTRKWAFVASHTRLKKEMIEGGAAKPLFSVYIQSSAVLSSTENIFL